MTGTPLTEIGPLAKSLSRNGVIVPTQIARRDYHYGTTGQGLLALRLIVGDRMVLDFTGQEYFISGLLPSEPHGQENILRGETSVAPRIHGPHGMALPCMSFLVRPVLAR